MKRFTMLLIALFSLLCPAPALELDGRTVLLLVTNGNSSDDLKQRLLSTRDQMGFSKQEVPIVFMTFQGSETEKEYCWRLGIDVKDSPILCIAQWSSPSSNGPKAVVNNAIVRRAGALQVDSMFVSYFKAVNQGEEGMAASDTSVEESPGTPGLLEIESYRFEASGKPFYLTTTGVRLRNADNRNLHNISIRFYSRLSNNLPWQLMDEQVVEKLPKGYVASRDFVGNTRTLKLTDDDGNAIRCFFRIEVEQGGQVTSREGEFIPSELPVDVH